MAKLRLAAIIGAAFFLSMPARADTDSTTFLVKITISESCDIHSTAPTNVDFGSNFRAVSVSEGVGALAVLCTQGTPWAIALDNGSHYDSTNSVRRMADSGATNFVAYGLYQSSGTSTPWNAVNTKSGTGTGTTSAVPIYGTVPSGADNVPAGNYSDSVTATITF
jgi:spore coat protein U-like protein